MAKIIDTNVNGNEVVLTLAKPVTAKDVTEATYTRNKTNAIADVLLNLANNFSFKKLVNITSDNVMNNPTVCANNSLPISLDVQISVSRPITEIASDLSLLCVVTPNVNFPIGERVRYYSSFDAVVKDVGINNTIYWAANAFFSRTDRPNTMCIGRVFTEATPAQLISGDTFTLDAFKTITDGAFDIEINDTFTNVSALNFSTVKTLSDIAAMINSKLGGKAICTLQGNGLAITTKTNGYNASLSYAMTPAEGTDVSSLLQLSDTTAQTLTTGYTPEGFIQECELIREFSKCAGRMIYGWCLDAQYRDTDLQKQFASWVEAQFLGVTALTTNSRAASNLADTNNIAYYAMNNSLIKTSVIYHHNPQVYPDVSYLALALSVNYGLANTALTMKFKQLPGIETTPMSETMLTALDARRCNCYVLMGNGTPTVRQGVQSATTWFTDSHVNISNYINQVQNNVFNVFLRNKKVPYTAAGQDLLVSAIVQISERFVRNGVFADREVEDISVENGKTTKKAYEITPAPIWGATASERAARIAPPIYVKAYEAGAMHTVALNVEVFN